MKFRKEKSMEINIMFWNLTKANFSFIKSEKSQLQSGNDKTYLSLSIVCSMGKK